MSDQALQDEKFAGQAAIVESKNGAFVAPPSSIQVIHGCEAQTFKAN